MRSNYILGAVFFSTTLSGCLLIQFVERTTCVRKDEQEFKASATRAPLMNVIVEIFFIFLQAVTTAFQIQVKDYDTYKHH